MAVTTGKTTPDGLKQGSPPHPSDKIPQIQVSRVNCFSGFTQHVIAPIKRPSFATSSLSDLHASSNLPFIKRPPELIHHLPIDSSIHNQPLQILQYNSTQLKPHNLHLTMFRRTLVNAPRLASRAISASSRSATRPVAPQITSPAIVSGTRQYHEKVLDHYSRPRNVGSMSKTDTDVGTGLVGAPACGDVMKLQIRVDPTNNTISDVKFKTFGCGSAIASSSYLTELVRGMTLEEAGRVRNTEIAKELCLPPVKRKFRSHTS
jgi:Fe-S cluster assembly scaffold IscU